VRLRRTLLAQGKRVFLNCGFDGCLSLYGASDWVHVEERLRQLSLGRTQSRAFLRAFLMTAAAVTIGSNGRIRIPPALRHRAGLAMEVLIVGALDRLESW